MSSSTTALRVAASAIISRVPASLLSKHAGSIVGLSGRFLFTLEKKSPAPMHQRQARAVRDTCDALGRIHIA
jgi:hypothetical protein